MSQPIHPVPRPKAPEAKPRIVHRPKWGAMFRAIRAMLLPRVPPGFPQKMLGSRLFRGFIQKPAVKARRVAAISLPQKYLGSRLFTRFAGFVQRPAIAGRHAVAAISLPQRYLLSRVFLRRFPAPLSFPPIRAIWATRAAPRGPLPGSRVYAIVRAAVPVVGDPYPRYEIIVISGT